jgi:hypothetical protein
MVMIQRSSDLDVACVLSLVQEEAGDSSRKKDARRYDSSYQRGPRRPAFPLSMPSRPEKPVGVQGAEDKRNTDMAQPNSGDDKL